MYPFASVGPAARPPRPWWFEFGIVYGGDGTIVADNVGIKDGPLIAAAPALLAALARMVCHSCTYQIGEAREGPSCSSCAGAREALERAAEAS